MEMQTRVSVRITINIVLNVNRNIDVNVKWELTLGNRTIVCASVPDEGGRW